MPLYLLLSFEFDLSQALNWLFDAPKSVLQYLCIIISPFFAYLGARMFFLNKRDYGAIKLTNEFIYASSFFVAPWRKIDWDDIERIDTFEYKFNPSSFTGVYLSSREAAKKELSWISKIILNLSFSYSHWSTKEIVLHVNLNFVEGNEEEIVDKIEHFWGQRVDQMIDQSAFLMTTMKNSLKGKGPLS